MRAARFYGAKDIRVEEVSDPDGPLGPTQVLLRPLWVGICGTDLHEYLAGPIVTPQGSHPLTGATLPQILGHEFSAEVEAAGSAVTGVSPGDHIAVMPLISCGECGYCRRGWDQLCTRMGAVGLSWRWGGMASHAVVDERQVLPLPSGVSDEQGAILEPGAVAAYGIERGGVRPGDAVLITGAGPIGALSVLAARAAGADQIIVSEPNAGRAARAASLGADAILNPLSADVRSEVFERTHGRGADVALECSGAGAGLRACLESARTRGTVVQVGLHTKDALIDPMDLALREITLAGVWCFAVHDFSRIAAQVARGTYPVERVVTSKIALSDVVADGFDALVDPGGDQIKVLVAPAGIA
jgi:(R,R)-butanediol dehydrogenase / meso-butanediol dehydrogenase / diacetyl reductase